MEKEATLPQHLDQVRIVRMKRKCHGIVVGLITRIMLNKLDLCIQKELSASGHLHYCGHS